MPLINGSKFSCAPCIRGHRATSCAHTDRILIEVRKPGRPLESCGHKLATCTCGRLADVWPMKDILPAWNAEESVNEGREFVGVRSPSAGGLSTKEKSKPRPRDRSKIIKRPKKKTVSPMSSPPIAASSLSSSNKSEMESQSRSSRVKPSIITRDSQHPPQSQSGLSTSIPKTSYSISSILHPVSPPRTITNPQLPPQTAPKLRSNDCRHHQERSRVSSRIEDLSIIATSTKPQAQ